MLMMKGIQLHVSVGITLLTIIGKYLGLLLTGLWL
jgi:hypothetical protein